MDSNMLFLPLCSLSLVRLICSEAVAIIKSGNVKRLCETKHKSFKKTYQLKLELRAPKIKAAWTLFKQNVVPDSHWAPRYGDGPDTITAQI